MIGTGQWMGPEVMTLAFPLGVFVVGLVWLALQRRPNE